MKQFLGYFSLNYRWWYVVFLPLTGYIFYYVFGVLSGNIGMGVSLAILLCIVMLFLLTKDLKRYLTIITLLKHGTTMSAIIEKIEDSQYIVASRSGKIIVCKAGALKFSSEPIFSDDINVFKIGSSIDVIVDKSNPRKKYVVMRERLLM